MDLPAITVLCAFIIRPVFCYENTNTDDNVIFEFLGIDPKMVSNHKLTTVDVPRMRKRDLQQGIAIKFQAIDEEISLLVRPRDSMLASDETPVYYAFWAQGYPQGVYFEKVVNAMKDVGELLEDPEHYATVTLSTDDSGKITVNGHLKSPANDARLIINALPTAIAERLLKNEYLIDNPVEDSADSAYHVIVELNYNDNLHNIAMTGLRGAKLNMTSLTSTATGNANATNNQSPDTLYLQMLIQVDTLYYDYFARWSNKKLSSILEYILAFWNGVDLIYRQIDNPKIKLNIAGIIISQDLQAVPYFYENTIVDEISYDIDKALSASTFFFYSIEKTSPIISFNTAIVMTKMHGIRQRHRRNHTLNGITTGHGNICVRNDSTQQNYAVALIYDNGAHAGIFTAAHEIGHLLGALNEGDSTHTQCTQMRNGSLMERRPTFSLNRTRFTSCALKDIRTQFENGKLSCLYNVPQMAGTRFPGFMPGSTSNIFTQCKSLGYDLPCQPNGNYIDVCSEMWCTFANDTDKCKHTKIAAPSGMACLKDDLNNYGRCLNSQCVSV